jgi:hypothetical protein
MPVADIPFNSHWPKFYVHPVSGLFLEARGKRYSPEPRFDETRMRWISSLTVHRKLNGIWFECCLKLFPDRFAKGECQFRYDLAENRMITHGNAWDIYRDAVYCVRKRQLSSKELKRLGLRNDPFPTDSAECALWSVSC